MAFADLVTPELKAKAKQLNDLKEKLEPLMDYAEWVGGCIWPEVYNRFPETRKYPHLSLRADWSIVVVESERQDDLADMLKHMADRGLDVDSLVGTMPRRRAHA